MLPAEVCRVAGHQCRHFAYTETVALCGIKIIQMGKQSRAHLCRKPRGSLCGKILRDDGGAKAGKAEGNKQKAIFCDQGAVGAADAAVDHFCNHKGHKKLKARLQ